MRWNLMFPFFIICQQSEIIPFKIGLLQSFVAMSVFMMLTPILNCCRHWSFFLLFKPSKRAQS